MELPEELSRMLKRIDEIKKLYDVTEAEMNCLLQMSALIKVLGHSPQLRAKLTKVLAAIDEVILDEMQSTEKK